MMPKFDGHAAFEAIRRKRPSAPILLMSGYSNEEAGQLFQLGGHADFVQKPFSLGDLSSKLQPLLG
jgi:two-component system cell cycle sensor histidine kinase/response regulator CckA